MGLGPGNWALGRVVGRSEAAPDLELGTCTLVAAKLLLRALGRVKPWAVYVCTRFARVNFARRAKYL